MYAVDRNHAHNGDAVSRRLDIGGPFHDPGNHDPAGVRVYGDMGGIVIPGNIYGVLQVLGLHGKPEVFASPTATERLVFLKDTEKTAAVKTAIKNRIPFFMTMLLQTN
jgi:hypothetical protein